MPEETYTGQITEDQLIFREILSLASLGKMCHSDFSEGAGAWSSNTLNFYHSVNQLMVLSIRHLDMGFIARMRQINKIFCDRWFVFKAQERDTNIKREMGMRMTLEYSDIKLAAVLLKLNEAGMYDEKSIHAVPIDTDEKDIDGLME